MPLQLLIIAIRSLNSFVFHLRHSIIYLHFLFSEMFYYFLCISSNCPSPNH